MTWHISESFVNHLFDDAVEYTAGGYFISVSTDSASIVSAKHSGLIEAAGDGTHLSSGADQHTEPLAVALLLALHNDE